MTRPGNRFSLPRAFPANRDQPLLSSRPSTFTAASAIGVCAGPRRLVWDVDHGPQHVALKGTTAAYVELCATGSAGTRRLRLKGSVGSKMQISVVRLPDASPQIEVEAAWSSGPRTSPTQRIAVQPTNRPEACACLHAIVRIARGEDLTIEQIAIEQNADQTHSSNCFATGSLAEFECPSGNRGLDENASGAEHDVSRRPPGRVHTPLIRFSRRTLNGC